VHVRIGSPPIIAPCYLGIDMTSRKQLMAADKSVADIARAIGADSLGYLSVDGLVHALGFSRDEVCLGCVTGEYPVHIAGEKERYQQQLETWS
jgi:amidophosphoribosyltransferase